MQRAIFHLSFPVRDLAAAKVFYCDFPGASIGRDNGQLKTGSENNSAWTNNPFKPHPFRRFDQLNRRCGSIGSLLTRSGRDWFRR